MEVDIKGVMLVCMLTCGCLHEEAGPFWGPEPLSRWPLPCREDHDGARDGTIDATTYHVRDGGGQSVESYLVELGELYRREHREYAGPRLMGVSSRHVDGTWFRVTYTWEGDHVTSATSISDRGDPNLTRWEYDELGRVTREVQTRTSSEYEHFDDDDCIDRKTFYIDETPRFIVTYMNPPDCLDAGYDFDSDADGDADVLWRTEFDPAGHPIRKHRRDNVGGESIPQGEWRYVWDGDLKLSEEAIDIDGLNQRTEFDYDCSEGMPFPPDHDLPRR